MRDLFINSIFKLAQFDKDLLLVTGDLGFGVLKPFWEKIPNQIINTGIAEQNMIGFASGLAMQGKKVYVYSIANFPSLRPLEQIRNDVAYHNLNVKIISIGAGFSYGSLGMSHHATEDIGVISSIPNITIYSPSTTDEIKMVAHHTYLENTPSYIRLGRENPKFNSNVPVTFTKPTFYIFKGSKYLFISYGDLIDEVVEAIDLLNKKGFVIDLLIFHMIKPLDYDFIYEKLDLYKNVFVIEEHSIIGGLGSLIKNKLVKFSNQIFLIGIRDNFTSAVGDQKYLRKLNAIDKISIIDTFLHNI